eukprot:5208421-Amphidinium_carterae.1
MPSPAADILSGHEVNLSLHAAPIYGRLEGCYELGRKGPRAPARCPKGCTCAKTLCMAKDCHKTWHCFATGQNARLLLALCFTFNRCCKLAQ